jgi:polyhydroxyalkanoate synthesis regulator phasin
MREITPGSILSSTQYGYLKVPKKVRTQCPHCRKQGEFALKANFYQIKTGVFSEGICSVCKKPSTFILMIKEHSTNQTKEVTVHVYDPHVTNGPLDKIQDNKRISQDLVRSYRSALNVNQSNDHSATAVMTKRVLESLVKNLNADKAKSQTLSEQFEQLPKNVDLSSPIQTLSQLTRPDSPFFQMLELEKEIDDKTAELLIELLEALIDYLYVVPEKIDTIKQKIEKNY